MPPFWRSFGMGSADGSCFLFLALEDVFTAELHVRFGWAFLCLFVACSSEGAHHG